MSADNFFTPSAGGKPEKEITSAVCSNERRAELRVNESHTVIGYVFRRRGFLSDNIEEQMIMNHRHHLYLVEENRASPSSPLFRSASCRSFLP